MANKIPLAYADVELQISSAISAGDTTFSLSSATDDDGNALPAGKYCFTIDNGSSNKEYLLGQLNGTDVTSVVSVSRQGVETSGAVRAHRVGAPAIVSDFATIQRVADVLRGQETLDGDNPMVYDAEPTLTDRKELATVAYVLDNVAGGTVNFDNQVITGVNAGETVAAGDLVYFKTSDQEWYKTDADTAATVEGVQLGIALGAGTDGAAITGGVQISGVYTTTGLTAGSTYYASNTAGEYGTSAGTTKQVIGYALSTTRLLMIPRNPQTVTTLEKEFLTNRQAGSLVPQVVTFTSSGTWTKDSNLSYVVVEVQAAGGNGGNATAGSSVGAYGGGGGAGGYSKKFILASALGATETVTVGAVGNPSSFGSHATSNQGANASSEIGGLGGTATGGDVNVTGGDGANGAESTTRNLVAGNGGSSIFGGGGRAGQNASNSGVDGEDARAYGAGGGGAQADNSTSAAGGAGGSGIVIVTEYYV